MEKELAEIRKEIIEARNLVIKNDNLMKNLGADIKAFGKKQEGFERKQMVSSAVAYVLFVALIVAGAVVGAKGYVAKAQSDAESLAIKAADATEAARLAREDLAASREASQAALAAYEKLDGGTPEEREAAVAALQAVDRSRISRLEAKALDDRGHSVILLLATELLDSGRIAYRRSDWKKAAADLTKAMEVMPDHPDANEHAFFLGSAALELRDYAVASENLQRYVDRFSGKLNKDYAYLLLARAYDAQGKKAEAVAALNAGLARHSASQFASQMRRHHSKLRKEMAAQ